MDKNKLKTNKAARVIVKDTKKNLAYIKKFRKMGISDFEIAKALDIPEDSLAFYK